MRCGCFSGHLHKILRRSAGQRRRVGLDIIFDLEKFTRMHGIDSTFHTTLKLAYAAWQEKEALLKN
jgi:hypothetical protein